jgi:hypothetical protein
VGCKAGSVVFGPAGSTGEGPVIDDGYFHFPGVAGGGKRGYNTVTCVAAGPGAPPAVPPPPTDPYPNERPRKSGDPWKDLQPAPEPMPAGLLSIGILAIVLCRRLKKT